MGAAHENDSDEKPAGIAVDTQRNAYVVGTTESTDFPIKNVFQSTFAGKEDAFVAKFDSSGILVYSTYLGASGSDLGYGIAVTMEATAVVTYITGATNSADFPTKSAFQSWLKGGFGAFIAKFDAVGSLVYSTYLGGSAGEKGYGIAVDPGDRVYVTGKTFSTDFPTKNAFQPNSGGFQDAFVAKISVQ